MLQTYFSLAKPRILLLVVVVTLVAAIVAGQGNIPLNTGVLLVLAGGLASAGAAFLNNYFDRDIDALMERTQHRSIPSGKASSGRVLLIGLMLIAASFAIALLINYMVALFVLAGDIIYIALYTLGLKRRTYLNIVFGGLAGSCAALGGWFAISPQISPIPIMMALLIFLWTPSHFWSFALVHQESYQQAGIPMLPVLTGGKQTTAFILLFTLLLVLGSLLLYFLGLFGEIYFVGAIILGVIFLTLSIRLWRQPRKERAWTNFKFSGIYLFALFVIVALDVLVQ